MKTAFFKHIALFGLLFTLSFAGAKAVNTEGTSLPTTFVNGELIPYTYLQEVNVFSDFKFKNKKQEEFYWRTVRDVKKTLPYAKTAGKVMRETDQHLKTIPTDKGRKAFLKEKEKELFAEFETDLRNMTMSQGRMLLLLIDRECNKTSFEIIKMYRGSFSAVFWQGVAKIFGSNLKSEYDGSDKDKIIERVIALVELGEL